MVVYQNPGHLASGLLASGHLAGDFVAWAGALLLLLLLQSLS